jgi:hypothetical protein
MLMASVRSVGWNLGTIRELGGGAVDTAKAINDALHKRPVEFTSRMAYTTSLPVLIGFTGGIMNYLMTGEPPQELTDYYFPRTGQLDEYGHPQRISLPSYMKDIAHVAYRSGEGVGGYFTKVRKMAESKANPAITLIADMLENSDWRYGEIRNSDDPWMKQIIDTAEFGAKQTIPFIYRYAVGDTQGTKVFDGTSKVKNAHYDRMNELTHAARLHEDAEFKRLANEGIRKGEITEKDIKLAQKHAAISPGVKKFKGLSMDQAISVYLYTIDDKKVSPEDREQLYTILTGKISRGWANVEALPDDNPRKMKLRKQLQILNMLDENGNPIEE